eukprot:764953-Hanusia_phi.AAC.5
MARVAGFPCWSVCPCRVSERRGDRKEDRGIGWAQRGRDSRIEVQFSKSEQQDQVASGSQECVWQRKLSGRREGKDTHFSPVDITSQKSSS